MNLHCKSFSGETTFEALPQSAKRIANSAVYLEYRRAPPMESKNKTQPKEYIQPSALRVAKQKLQAEAKREISKKKNAAKLKPE